MKAETSLSENPLGYEPIPRLLINFSIPAIISCLVNSIYNIVDQIFIGQGVGYQGNAATTVAFPLMIILTAFGTTVGSGSSALAAIRLGEGKDRDAKKALKQCVPVYHWARACHYDRGHRLFAAHPLAVWR